MCLTTGNMRGKATIAWFTKLPCLKWSFLLCLLGDKDHERVFDTLGSLSNDKENVISKYNFSFL